MKFKHTNRTLTEVGILLRKGLQQELIDQKHNATGRLSRGLKYHVDKKINAVNVFSSVSYWKAVNNPIFAKIPSYNAIASWVRAKRGIESTPAAISRIYAKMILLLGVLGLKASTLNFRKLHGFPRQADHFFSGMSNRVEHQKLSQVAA